LRPTIRSMKRVTAAAIVASALLLLAPSTAMAATTGTSPHWFTGKINLDRFSGSETTYYLMQRLSNFFNQTSIFGCTLQSADRRTCTTADTADTDTKDNWDRNEVTQGAGIGSGGGIGQLCGTIGTGGLLVDAARSSRPKGGSDCADSVFVPLAKDALIGVDWRGNTPASGATVGNPAAGWRPGNPVNGPYTGNPVTDISNVGGTSSIAYRIYCDTNPATAITDWGQLTDPAQPVGSGAPIGVPIIVWGIQTSSGTYSVWNTYVGCDMNTKASAAHIIQENNGPQVLRVAASEHSGDAVATEQEVEQSLYMSSFGVFASNPYVRGGGLATTINGTAVTAAKISLNQVATVRTLYNVYRTSTLRASIAGFLNWIDTSDATEHGVDATTGVNYATEITNAITTTFGFVRVTSPLIPSGDIADTAS
jgi:ABC-type phosphate transport system substrate-binding protein